jgi:hypothetical protein
MAPPTAGGSPGRSSDQLAFARYLHAAHDAQVKVAASHDGE